LERAADRELSRRERGERAGLVFAAAALAAAGWLRSRSSLALDLAEGPVWAAAIPAEPAQPAALWRYDPSKRDLRGVLLPGAGPARRTAASNAAAALGAGRLRWLEGASSPDPGLASRWSAGPRLAARLLRALTGRPPLRSDLTRPDWAFAALEALSLPPGERPLAELPANAAGLDRLKSRFFGAAPPSAKAPTVEVLNASGKDGLALTVTNALRARGIDVLYYGTAPAEPATRILDRDGDRRAALKVRGALGVDAPILTELVPYPKPEEATLVLGKDFPEASLKAFF
jgi:LytR cell envelope-related transcriptional attenuator